MWEANESQLASWQIRETCNLGDSKLSKRYDVDFAEDELGLRTRRGRKGRLQMFGMWLGFRNLKTKVHTTPSQSPFFVNLMKFMIRPLVSKN